MDSSFWFDAINLGWSIVYIEGAQVIIKKKYIVFLSLKIVFVLANSVDPDEMQHLIWLFTVLSKYDLGVTSIRRVKLVLLTCDPFIFTLNDSKGAEW